MYPIKNHADLLNLKETFGYLPTNWHSSETDAPFEQYALIILYIDFFFCVNLDISIIKCRSIIKYDGDLLTDTLTAPPSIYWYLGSTTIENVLLYLACHVLFFP